MKIQIDTDQMQSVGENLSVIEQDGKLILILDTQVEGELSSTGKMRTVSSSGGFTKLPGDLKGNIYIGRKAR